MQNYVTINDRQKPDTLPHLKKSLLTSVFDSINRLQSAGVPINSKFFLFIFVQIWLPSHCFERRKKKLKMNLTDAIIIIVIIIIYISMISLSWIILATIIM